MNNNQEHYIKLQQQEDSLEKTLRCELAQAHSTDDLTQRIHKIVNELGFTDFLFLRLGRVWKNDSLRGLLHSMPEELIHAYHKSKMHETDLIIKYTRVNTQPIFSSQIYDYIDQAPFKIPLTVENRQLIELHNQFHFFEHCVLPMPAINGNGHVQLLLSSVNCSKRELQSIAIPIISICRCLCKTIDFVSTKKFCSTFIDQKDNPVSITQKPLDILHRLSNSDTTITELATKMFISPITAHQHIAAARKALCTNTNIGAIVKAIKLGLIHLE